MKFLKKTSILFAAFLFFSCSKDSNNDTEQPTKKNVAPSAFNLTTITNEATEVPILPSFSWQKANDADGDSVTYDLYLDTNATPTTKLASNLTTATYAMTVELDANTTYYWSVTAKDSEGNTTSSAVFSFTTVANNAPEAFNLLTLENESENSSLTPSFTWETSIDPEGETVIYEFYLDTAGNPETKLGESLVDTSYTITSSLMYNTTYYWKVIAIDENDNSTESETFSFTTQMNPPPSSFNLSQIEDEATTVDLFPTFNWEEAVDDGAVTYDLYLSLDENPELFESDITATTFEITSKLFLNQTYYWKVVAKDTSDNETESEIFSFTTRGLNLSANALTNTAGFSPRAQHTSVIFNNKMWVIGGYDGNGAIGNGTFYNDVWSSTDGINWTLETSDAEFSGRYDHTSIVYDSKIWVIAGKAFDVPGRPANGPYVDMNDVWNSSDGINWTQVTNNAPFSGRGGHTLDIYNGKLYLISGGFNSFGTEDVWSTTNGVSWILETDQLAFNASDRHNHRTLSLNNDFYMAGGTGSHNGYDEIWKSNDLKNWTSIAENLEFLYRRAPSFVNYEDNLIFMCGAKPNRTVTNTGAYQSDIWYSNDGINWSVGQEQAPYLERTYHTTVIFNGKILIIGGRNATGYLNDVWAFD